MIQSNNTRPIGYWETTKRHYPLANYPPRTAKDLEIDDLKRENEAAYQRIQELSAELVRLGYDPTSKRK